MILGRENISIIFLDGRNLQIISNHKLKGMILVRVATTEFPRNSYLDETFTVHSQTKKLNF